MPRRAATVVMCLASIIALSACAPAAALSHDEQTGVPVEVWKKVLQDEPYQHGEILGELTETPGSLTRTFFSDAHKSAARRIVKWMEDAGMDAWRDVMGNVHGVLNGSDLDAPAVLLGSHYDTVVDAGKWDGALGVLLAIAATKGLVVEALHRQGRLQQLLDLQLPNDDIQVPRGLAHGALPSSIRVIAFSDEEGIRFKSTFLGSRAVAGSLVRHGQMDRADASGLSVADVLRNNGVADPAAAVRSLALPREAVKHYVEFHIEQGPVLERRGVPLGVVAGIAGQTWLNVDVGGEQGHAGTVPMSMRADPLAAAAAAIGAIEATCRGETVRGVSAAEDAAQPLDVAPENLVCTVGRLAVHPGQINSIARWANFTVDVRCRHDEFRAATVAAITRRVDALCAARGVTCAVGETHSAVAVHSDGALMAKLKAGVLAAQPLLGRMLPAAVKSGGGGSGGSCSADNEKNKDGSCDSATTPLSAVGQAEVPLLLSGAGHDAMALADLTRIAMVFVRCRGGVSHNPAEHVEPADVGAAAAAMASFLELDVLDAARHGDAEFPPLEFGGSE